MKQKKKLIDANQIFQEYTQDLDEDVVDDLDYLRRLENNVLDRDLTVRQYAAQLKVIIDSHTLELHRRKLLTIDLTDALEDSCRNIGNLKANHDIMLYSRSYEKHVTERPTNIPSSRTISRYEDSILKDQRQEKVK